MTQPDPSLTDEQITVELAPLAAVIHRTLIANPVRLGDTADLTGVLTLAVAAYIGPLVGDVPALLAEVTRLREQLAQVAELLPADPADDINASWIPPRHLRAALAARTAT